QFERYDLPLILMFLDFIAAFDSVTRQKLWKILENDGMPLKFVELMKAYYDASWLVSTGSVGVIATTMNNSFAVGNAIVTDLKKKTNRTHPKPDKVEYDSFLKIK
ncbi:hypothetical protein QYM36_008093, partial [Artemia franciscana]